MYDTKSWQSVTKMRFQSILISIFNSAIQIRYLKATRVYLWVKHLNMYGVPKYKYLSIVTYKYLSTSTQVHEKYLSTYLMYLSIGHYYV